MTDREVSKLIKEFKVPLHVQRHCAAVAKFCVELGKKMIAAGIKIDLKLLRQAAMLHDLLRIIDFKTLEPEKFPDPVSPEDIEFWKQLREKFSGMHHADAAAQILCERGFHDVAQIIKTHKYVQIKDSFKTWEEKILYYGDKRVQHDKIVALAERLADGRKRNFPFISGEEPDDELDKKVFELEKEILKKIRNLKH